MNLYAYREYSPPSFADDERHLDAPQRFVLPDYSWAHQGSAGNRVLRFRHRNGSGPEVECIYRGQGAEDPNVPVEDSTRELVWMFESCTDGSSWGQVFEADYLHLHLEGSDPRYGKGKAELILREPPPCTCVDNPPLDAGFDAGCGMDASCAPECLSFEASATRRYEPDAHEDFELTAPRSGRFALPPALPVLEGNAGNQTATLRFRHGDCAEVVCTYRGGASVEHPTEPQDIALGGHYFFESCDNGMIAGDLAAADWIRIRVEGGDSLRGDTRIGGPFTEESPCGPVEPDPDCDDGEPTCQPTGTPETVCNGVDDDCNGAIDEGFEPAPSTCGVGACLASGTITCASGQLHDDCAPGTPAPSDATCNGIDDDCDGLVDEDYAGAPTSCGVGACAASGALECVAGVEVDTCAPGTPAPSDVTCNGIDDDCDGLVDEDYVPYSTLCGFGACQGIGTALCTAGQIVDTCQPACFTEQCGSGEDDDGDGLVDCADPDCAGDALCTETRCGDNQDDDGDGYVDCEDPDCADAPICFAEICGDGQDNDGNGLVDCLDPACRYEPACSNEICDNGFDDDNDGVVDCADPVCSRTAYCTTPPPNPADIAPELPVGLALSTYDVSRFLYESPNPIQVGVAPGTIEEVRTARATGRVFDTAGAPLSNVTVTVLHHPEYGSTRTRSDGAYDFVVNGGGFLVLDFRKEGFLPVQRRVSLKWNELAHVDGVHLTALDPVATPIDLGATVVPQVARGTTRQDEDGARQATVLVKPGTSAGLLTRNGMTMPLERITFRATEYTVGEQGVRAMPGQLPPASGYTYAVELSADEAIASGEATISFSQPVSFYLENFIGAPVGSAVPMGYYDRDRAVWVPSENGRVVEVLGTVDGSARLDIDGDGLENAPQEIEALGIDTAELRELATLYPVPTQLWRVPVSHFTPWDCNWPYGPPPGSGPPPPPFAGGGGGPECDGDEECGDDDDGDEEEEDHQPRNPNDDPTPCNDEASGSTIYCQSQAVGETIPVVGADLNLVYRSDRIPGARASQTAIVVVAGATVPASLNSISLTIRVAGTDFRYEFPPEPNQLFRFSWNGRDAFGRVLKGAHEGSVSVCYEYPLQYYATPAAFERAFAQAAAEGATVFGRRESANIQSCRTERVRFWSPMRSITGGLSLSKLHEYDPESGRVFFGDGRVADLKSEELRYMFETDNHVPRWIRSSSDGTMYYLSGGRGYQSAIYAQSLTGNMRVVAGLRFGRSCLPMSDGDLASDVDSCDISGLALGTDGSVYFGDVVAANGRSSQRFWRIDSEGRFRFVGGGGAVRPWESPNLDARYLLTTPAPLAPLTVGLDGSVYFVDTPNHLDSERFGWMIYRIGPDGRVYPVVGYKSATNVPDSIEIRDQAGGSVFLRTEVTDLAVAPDGTLYFTTAPDSSSTRFYRNERRLWRVNPEGRVTRLLFVADPPGSSSGRVVAKRWTASEPTMSIAPLIPLSIGRIALDQSGQLYFVAEGPSVGSGIGVWNPDSDDASIVSSQGLGAPSPPTELGNAALVGWGWNSTGFQSRNIAPHPSGGVVALAQYSSSVFSVPLAERGRAFARPFDVLLPHGREVHAFDVKRGRHLWDFDRDTGTILRTFVYDDQGRVSRIEEPNGRITFIEYAEDGTFSSIVAPFGQRTELRSTNGYVSEVIEPNGATHHLEFGPGGLLRAYTNPRAESWSFDYDSVGRLRSDTAPDGGTQRLRSAYLDDGGREVRLTTAEGRSTVYRSRGPAGRSRETIHPTGLTSRRITTSSGMSATGVDGTVLDVRFTADPRFGLRDPVAGSTTIRTPSNRTMTVTRTRTEALSSWATGFPTISSRTETRRTSDNRTWSSHYVHADREYRYVSPLGREMRVRVDDLRRPVRMQVSGLSPVTMEYDERGLLTAIRTQDGDRLREMIRGYGADGYLRLLGLPNGSTLAMDPDQSGRARSVTRSDQESVHFGWDPVGNLSSVSPPGRPSHQLEYSHRNHLTRYSAPSVAGTDSVITWQDDLDGKLDLMSLADGRTVDLRYDAGGRVIEMHNSRGVTAYTYHPTYGQLTRVTAPGGQQVNLAWDGFLKTSEAWAGAITGTVAYRYDTHLRMDRRTVVGTAIDYGYDADNLLTRAGALTIGRHPQHGLESSTTVSNTTTSTLYNGFGEPQSWTANHPGGSLGFAYEYDALGRIVQRTEQNGTQTRVFEYAYDVVGRLTAVSLNGAVVESYDYDPNGNRTYAENATGTLSAADIEHDAQDRLVRYGNLRFTYNLHGQLQTRENVSSGQITQYTYDELGNLTRVQLHGGTVIDYLIDGFGRRIGKRVNGVLERGWLYQDQLNPIAELTSTGTVRSRFVYGTKGHVPDLVLRDGRTYRVLTDHLGSVRRVVDSATGAIAQELDYDAWGRVVTDTNPGFQPFGYAGGLYDRDTRLVRFGARDYDPEIGRWTAKDPILFRAGSPNLYKYVSNDPLNRIDPTGLYDYNAQQTRCMLINAVREYTDSDGLVNNLLEAFKNHRGMGKYDFKNTQAEDTFEVAGHGRLAADQFGNYFAGYTTTAGFGAFGDQATRFFGHAMSLIENRTFDDVGSITMIDRGVVDGLLHQDDGRDCDELCM